MNPQNAELSLLGVGLWLLQNQDLQDHRGERPV